MKADELSRRLEDIFVDKWDVYSDSPTYLADKEASVKRFAERLAKASGKEAYIQEPQNIDNYYRLQICLTPRSPSNRFTLDFDRVKRDGEVVYLNVLCSMLAPVSEASWHVYRVTDSQLVLESHDLLDPVFLSRHPEWQSLAHEVTRIGRETDLCALSWDITRQAADVSWPRPQFAPDSSQLRHFLFTGYYDD